MANKPKNINPAIAQRLRYERGLLCLTQAEVANRVGANESTYRMWELSASEPSSETLVKLAKLFNVSTDYLLGIEDRPLNIPPELEGVQVAFHDGLDGLTQEDINDVAEYIEFLRNKRNK